MRIKVRWFLCVFGVLLAMGWGLFPDREPIVIQVAKSNWISWNLLSLNPYLRSDDVGPVVLKFTDFPTYSDSYESFARGETEGIATTIFEAILAAVNDVPLKVVLIMDYTVGSDALLAGVEITSLIGLKGKKIGVEKGSIAHYTLLKAIDKSGLSIEDVELVYDSMPNLQVAYRDRKIDAISLFEPFLSAMKRQRESRVLFSSKEIPGKICDVFCVTEGVLERVPDFKASILDHWEFNLGGLRVEEGAATSGPATSDAAIIRGERAGTSGVFFTDRLENEVAFGSFEAPGYLVEAMQEMQAFMWAQGVIPTTVNIRELVIFSGGDRPQ
ncbi:MAG: NitT/TauT family transport system substrate-binding protein [Candidatus Marinamargulisbacteria bacterium]